MKTATVRDLRNNFARVSRWLKAGERVEITSRGEPIGTITPSSTSKTKAHESEKARKEKFRKRFGPEHVRWMKEVYGNKVLPGNGVLLMREGTKW